MCRAYAERGLLDRARREGKDWTAMQVELGWPIRDGREAAWCEPTWTPDEAVAAVLQLGCLGQELGNARVMQAMDRCTVRWGKGWEDTVGGRRRATMLLIELVGLRFKVCGVRARRNETGFFKLPAAAGGTSAHDYDLEEDAGDDIPRFILYC